MKVSTARRVLGIFQRLPVGFYIWTLDRQITMTPSRRVRGRHEFEQDMVDGIGVGWIDRHHADRGVLVHVHGGGYTSGPFAAMWAWLADLCARTGMAGVMVDYRLGGEAPYPAAPDDVEQVIGKLGADGVLDVPWAIIGDSAGGGLALVTARRLLDGTGPMPGCLVLASPFVDMRLDHPDIAALDRRDPSISVEMLERGRARYAPGQDLSNPELSPTEARLDDLPPVHLRVGTDEIFLPDIELFAAKLRAADVVLDYHVEPGGIHVYPMLIDDEMSQRALASQAAFVIDHLGVGR